MIAVGAAAAGGSADSSRQLGAAVAEATTALAHVQAAAAAAAATAAVKAGATAATAAKACQGNLEQPIWVLTRPCQNPHVGAAVLVYQDLFATSDSVNTQLLCKSGIQASLVVASLDRVSSAIGAVV